MSSDSESGQFIVLFQDDVTSEEIDEQIKELKAAGGIVKTIWARDKGDILNGFAATIPETFLVSLKGLQPSKITSIERDEEVTTQQGLGAL